MQNISLMKKSLLYSLLLMAVPVLGFTSCNDDDDLPDVSFQLNVENAVETDGAIYVVRGDTLKITGIDVINNEKDKSAIITAATYYWDAFRVGTSLVPPFAFSFATNDETPLGHHEIAIECPVYAVDKSAAVANLFYSVEVVAAESDIPTTGDTPSTTFGISSHILEN